MDSKSNEGIDVDIKRVADAQDNIESEDLGLNKLSINSETRSTRSDSTHSLEEWEKLAIENHEEDKSPGQVDFESTTCLEVSGFPAQFKTHDVIAIFKNIDTTAIKLKWINDTSAIAIFPNQESGN